MKDCFLVAKDLDMSGSFIIKLLMKLRGLPLKDLTLQGFTIIQAKAALSLHPGYT